MKLFLILIPIGIIILTVLALILLKRKKSKPTKTAYTCINSCTTPLTIDKNLKGYENKEECMNNCEIQDGWVKNEQNVCVPLSTTKKLKCRLSDKNCFLSDYECWNQTLEENWKCSPYGMGCEKTKCNILDKDCFLDREECEEKCKFQCTSPSGCIQTISCKGENCFTNKDKCNEACKNFECNEFCQLKLCDSKDEECLKSTKEQNFNKCQTKCGLFRCKNNVCNYLDPNSPNPTYCDPTSDTNCFRGIENCVNACNSDNNNFKCDSELGNCIQVFGDPKSRKDQCEGSKCYATSLDCMNECKSKGFSCTDNCEREVDCPVDGKHLGVKCWKSKDLCKNLCKNGYFYTCNPDPLNKGQCINVPKCDTSKDNCFFGFSSEEASWRCGNAC